MIIIIINKITSLVKSMPPKGGHSSDNHHYHQNIKSMMPPKGGHPYGEVHHDRVRRLPREEHQVNHLVHHHYVHSYNHRHHHHNDIQNHRRCHRFSPLVELTPLPSSQSSTTGVTSPLGPRSTHSIFITLVINIVIITTVIMKSPSLSSS